ncbi:kinesin-like protein KIN-12D [Punica granatum]|uniref:Kinesin-like protein KIN-12D n=1 Tax=Punica granatum TaxID=22663 RepID=A0A6P8CP68_PUNGR|nr:kinesin-like protein KIN-12D [Punica granatum]
MLRDLKFLRRNSGKNEEIENIPVSSRASSLAQPSLDSSRAPLNAIQEPVVTSRPEPESGAKSKADRTPVKPKGPALPARTPEKYSLGVSARHRFGWAKNEPSETGEDAKGDLSNYSVSSRGVAGTLTTPKINRTVGRAYSNYSETNSTQSTPNKSVSKPPPSAIFKSKIDGNGGGRWGNFSALYRGCPSSNGPSTIVNTVEVPHFDLKEDPSFWMDHNVQVLIRVRPLNSMERSMHGYNRCLKQESAQSITWIGQPETRFTFDHVACETVDQETLFRMVGLPMVENCLSGYNSCMFAYGQTGSGKTFTMLGEIEDLEFKPSPNRGMTPRIFEFLFARIQAEEDSRSDEKLKYNCKCSFLEIYNEQVTDLLDPSSTNLLLREDVKKGVYVENLSEFEVQTVGDIVRLLIQGSSNRRVAATNMNRESSRSHSVFTCVIESRWEKDSTTNLRFARLNLVDLAGSERQKTSGAEGDRLKEAANINKSLSTLGHVIMVLVDVANGKPKHVPYRDSRLTFLLQDSLGGNSKTVIVANVSPSICAAAETLNTLKFAQRAKLIQNNAVVNEDSTGDVIALQRQIRLLQEELAALKRQNVSRSLSFGSISIDDDMELEEEVPLENKGEEGSQRAEELLGFESKGVVRMSTKQLKSLETTLAGALRREQMADMSIKQLEAEIEQLNRLVHQREEDTRCTKMMLKFREDKIQRMESLTAGSINSESYLREENKALAEEIQLLQAKVDKNPEVTRFALENIRLLDQLRRFQEFYEEGERDILLQEVSKLRDQLLQFIDANPEQHIYLSLQPQEAVHLSKENGSLHSELKNTQNELEECRNNLTSCLQENAKLSREIQDLRSMFDKLNAQENGLAGNFKSTKDFPEEIVELQLELDILKILLQEERVSRVESEERAICLSRDLEMMTEKLSSTTKLFEEVNSELHEAKSVIQALESEQVLSINELEDLKNSNNQYTKLLSLKEVEIAALKKQISSSVILRDQPPNEKVQSDESPLRFRLNRMHQSLEKAKQLNLWYQSDLAFQASNEEEMDQVRGQVEAETAEVIVCMQEELALLQQQIRDSELKEIETEKKTIFLENENRHLSELLEEKEMELQNLSEEWKLLTTEIEEVLGDGHESLVVASDELDNINSSFPQRRFLISEHLDQMVRAISEKEVVIEELSSCLEEANSKRNNLESMLKSLRGAALVITEAHQQECREKEKEIRLLSSQLNGKSYEVQRLKERLKLAKDNMRNASTCATAAFVVVSRLSEVNFNHLSELKQKDSELRESVEMVMKKDLLLDEQAFKIEELEKQIESLRQALSGEKQHVNAMKQRLEDVEEGNILQARHMLEKLNSGTCTLRSSMSTLLDDEKHPERTNDKKTDTFFHLGEEREIETENCQEKSTDLGLVEGPKAEDCDLPCKEGQLGDWYQCEGNSDFGGSYHGEYGRDATILMLKREVGSALESLKHMQVEMAKLQIEKEERQLSEKQERENMNHLAGQVLSLQEVMNRFEDESKLKIETFYSKVQTFELMMLDVGNDWCMVKELLEQEVGDAEMAAAEKSAEASFDLAKFTEAQDTLKEADVLINGLTIANETMKLEVERLKRSETSLFKERDALTEEIHNLQSINGKRDQQLASLEEQIGLHLMETGNLFAEVEGIVAELAKTCEEKFVLLADEFCPVKSSVFDSVKLVKSWLEEIWSEIIVRDCALSSLHLCHMGILLETVTGLNAENGLLQHGLCQTDSLLSDLREQNSRSRRELETCRFLEGKLLADIKNGFDRISRKEKEAVDLSCRINGFERKILELQLQEEMMLQRSDSIGSQLAVLMKELDLSNLSAAKLLKEEEELLNSEFEKFELQLCSKEFESVILTREMEEMAFQKAKLVDNLEKLSREMILSGIDAELEELLLMEHDSDNSTMQRALEETEKEMAEMKNETSVVLRDLAEKRSECESSLTSLERLNRETLQLKDKIVFLETNISGLSSDLEVKNAELKELRDSQSLLTEELSQKTRKLEANEEFKQEFLFQSNLNTRNCTQLVKNINASHSILFDLLERRSFTLADKMFQQICEDRELGTKFMGEFMSLDSHIEELMSENSALRAELSRKDSILEGLSFDLRLLQESTSICQDQKDEMEKMVASVEALEDELAMKSDELDAVEAHAEMLKAQVLEKSDTIALLELDLVKERESVRYLSEENVGLKASIEEALAAKISSEEELAERRKLNESLEMEVSDVTDTVNQLNAAVEYLKTELNELAFERDQLQAKALDLKEKLQKTQTVAEKYEAVAIEAQEMAEARESYAQDKEEEVKLLELSVRELGCTVDALENKVDIVKGEAERQRLLREELESELHSVKNQIEKFKNADADMKMHLDEKKADLEKALKQIQILERDIAKKELEISNCRSHISELNLHAEAQASEYKQKFKALEAMAEQVRAEAASTQASNSIPQKLEKNSSRPRGSGSPFKCIGLGLAQQIKSEKDEDLISARLRIDELESAVASKQKEIFTLNAKLAAAESMTHDVIRDLLGVKLDVTSYVSLLHTQQEEKISGKPEGKISEPQHEVIRLKEQLNEFIMERQGWLDEMDRRQAELVAAQVALESLRQRDQLLKTENDMLKVENSNYKKMVMELEEETSRLSGQQNLQQRIHHHAKIKEENNMLKIQNEELSNKLRRAEFVLSRVKEELARYRASIGKNPYVNLDEEQLLNNKLKETEEERVQLAQKLLGLCTSVLKVAGFTRPVSKVSPSIAEEALEQLKKKLDLMASELHDLKTKNKMYSEMIRLSELMPQQPSPVGLRADENCRTPRRTSHSSYLSSFDR